MSPFDLFAAVFVMLPTGQIDAHITGPLPAAACQVAVAQAPSGARAGCMDRQSVDLMLDTLCVGPFTAGPDRRYVCNL